MKPQHRLALLIVGMYCVLLYFRKFFDSLSMMFLVQGLIVVYGYGGDVKKFEKIILWHPEMRLKSFLLYGVLIFSSYGYFLEFRLDSKEGAVLDWQLY